MDQDSGLIINEIILTVEDVFIISGRGLEVTGCQQNGSAEVKVGDRVEILAPDEK